MIEIEVIARDGHDSDSYKVLLPRTLAVGVLCPPDSPDQNHQNPAPLARNLAKTEKRLWGLASCCDCL